MSIGADGANVGEGRFVVGQRVRTRAPRPSGHTRLPRYLAERHGVIERVHGLFPLADARAEGRTTEPPHLLCSVVFESRELWGEASAGFRVSADLWDVYLEEVP